MGGWRPPLLMVDRIVDFKYGENGFVKVIKHIAYNEPYLQGHFPDDPIMPGVMISEIFGQASEYYSFLTDIFDIYQQSYPDDGLRDLRGLCAVIHDEKIRNIIRQRRSEVRGVLAAQNLKFKTLLIPATPLKSPASWPFLMLTVLSITLFPRMSAGILLAREPSLTSGKSQNNERY